MAMVMTTKEEIAVMSFMFKDFQVQVVMMNGEPWFVAKDVCDVLGYGNTPEAVRKHVDPLDKNTITIRDGINRGNPNKVVINESGLYSIILSSQMPEARNFKRWVTNEIMPSIRKHGMYATDELLENPDLLIQVVTKLKEERQARLEAEQKLAIAKPKVEAFDAYMDADGTHSLTDVAKALGMSPKNMCNKLREYGVLLKLPHNAPASKYTENGYFVVVSGVNKRNNRAFTQTRVTPKGVEFIRQMLDSSQ